ncbi:hypothetical protein AB205_0187260 [Aquarana catesbeiana]|uniref:Uncharacterized protein n=1 Tax=Aquarana catesbeiana TaxID=8400 RepID=A0A2G9S9G6_AQUCT|nr:hypothetical protein AB205_0187260 [Aquarana catesbeiana]
MAETQQVRNSSNEEEESPEPKMSRRKRFKASNTAFVEMLDILKRANYDGKYGPYLNPNVGKAKIMTKVVKREKRLGMSEDNRNPPHQPPEGGEQRTQPEDVEEGEVVEIVTTGDVHVVEEQSTLFTTDSAQRLIQDIMYCSQDLDIIKQKTNEVEQKLKNMIDVLGRI